MPGLIRVLPSLKEMLAEKPRVATGIVTARSPAGRYQVSIGGRTVGVRSATSGSFGVRETIQVGARVVVVRTDVGSFVVGEPSLKERELKEVRVSG